MTSRFGYARGGLIGAGLYHYGQRYYDPNLMRSTQLDPLLNATDARQANRYQYAGGDPVNQIDPDRMASCSTFGSGGACKAAKNLAKRPGQTAAGLGGIAVGAAVAGTCVSFAGEVGAAEYCVKAGGAPAVSGAILLAEASNGNR